MAQEGKGTAEEPGGNGQEPRGRARRGRGTPQEAPPTAAASPGIVSVLLRAVGMGQGQETDVVRVARWSGGFIILSGVVLALWGLILPAFRPSFNAQLQIFWGALIAPAWTGVVIILLAELAERIRKSS